MTDTSDFHNFSEDLISEVFQQKLLYDKGVGNYYRNKVVKEKIWSEIGERLGKSAEECKKRWKALRERFSRELKKEYESARSSAVEKVQWEYYEMLIFLKDHVGTRSIGSDLGTQDSIFDSISVSEETEAFSELCSTPSKKVEEISGGTVSTSINEDFMKSIARLIDELPPFAQEETRGKIYDIVRDVRMKYLFKK